MHSLRVTFNVVAFLTPYLVAVLLWMGIRNFVSFLRHLEATFGGDAFYQSFFFCLPLVIASLI